MVIIWNHLGLRLGGRVALQGLPDQRQVRRPFLLQQLGEQGRVILPLAVVAIRRQALQQMRRSVS